MKSKLVAPLSLAAAVAVLFSLQVEMASSQLAAPSTSFKAQGPGGRGGAPGAAGPRAGLSGTERAFFTRSRDTFQEGHGAAQRLGPSMRPDHWSGWHVKTRV